MESFRVCSPTTGNLEVAPTALVTAREQTECELVTQFRRFVPFSAAQACNEVCCLLLLLEVSSGQE